MVVRSHDLTVVGVTLLRIESSLIRACKTHNSLAGFFRHGGKLKQTENRTNMEQRTYNVDENGIYGRFGGTYQI